MNKRKIIMIAGACLVSAILGALLFRVISQAVVKISTCELKECELKYFETKSKLTDEVQLYINKVAPTSDLRACALIDACEKYSLDVKFALAQGEVESHFGTKGLAAKTNSVWNVGAYDKMGFSTILKRYKYNHPNESIEPYVKLIYENYMTDKTEEGLMNKFVDHDGKRYATASDYEERIRLKYKYIVQTTKIDSLQKAMNHWAVKANRLNLGE